MSTTDESPRTSLPQSRLDVPDSVDEKDFFTMDGKPTLVSHADLEKTVPNEEKEYLDELERYWVNEPYSFVVIYRNRAEQELRYYVVEPYLSETEKELVDFFKDQLKTSINFENTSTEATASERAETVRDQTANLIDRYGLADMTPNNNEENFGVMDAFKEWAIDQIKAGVEILNSSDDMVDHVPVERDPETGERNKLDDNQIQKVIYHLVRDFIKYDKIDPIKHDVNIEDIYCNGYREPVFVYHTKYEQMITNIQFGRQELDEFVIKLAQKAGKGISKRQPSVDATLADGSRAQLTLGAEITEKGTNFTIRQFKDVPFTPIDLINWETFSLDQMVYLWLAIESGKSMVIAGGTASGKTTTLNALSLFISSKSRMISIEDTRELIIPQKNWVADNTRESFQGDDASEIDEFELMQDALRQRPDYLIMGEVRGEEGRTLFQAMNTGHTVFTTFHANSSKEVIRRFTQEPINVAESMFGALDIIINQQQHQIGGRPVRRAKSILEIDEFIASKGEFTVNETFTWDSVDDTFHANTVRSRLMEEVRRERGWNEGKFATEKEQRKIVLAYMIKEGINSYAGVAATIQAYMHNPEVVMGLIKDNELADRIENLREMKTVEIDVDPEKEELVPRPNPNPELLEEAKEIVANADDLLAEFETESENLAESLVDYSESRQKSQDLAESIAHEYEESVGGGGASAPADSAANELDGVDVADEIDEEELERVVEKDDVDLDSPIGSETAPPSEDESIESNSGSVSEGGTEASESAAGESDTPPVDDAVQPDSVTEADSKTGSEGATTEQDTPDTDERESEPQQDEEMVAEATPDTLGESRHEQSDAEAEEETSQPSPSRDDGESPDEPQDDVDEPSAEPEEDSEAETHEETAQPTTAASNSSSEGESEPNTTEDTDSGSGMLGRFLSRGGTDDSEEDAEGEDKSDAPERPDTQESDDEPTDSPDQPDKDGDTPTTPPSDSDGEDPGDVSESDDGDSDTNIEFSLDVDNYKDDSAGESAEDSAEADVANDGGARTSNSTSTELPSADSPTASEDTHSTNEAPEITDIEDVEIDESELDKLLEEENDESDGEEE